ncbi:MAG TPA: cytochrome c family protein [Devosiaceae bacterium]|nr:cytochrome c family protein [Devosiaceae bacterium]
MDSFELNKIIGAILGTLLFVMAVGFLAEAVYAPIVGQGPGYDLPEPAAAAAATPAAATPSVPLPQLLAQADPTQGADSVKKCQSCHDFSEGGANKTGPDLFNIVDRKIASAPGFPFSDALKAHANDTWTFENLSKWLASPKTFAPGTKMTFAGIPDDSERANVLAYLRTLSHNPAPLPAVTADAPAAKAGAAAPTANATTPASNTPAPAAPSATPAPTATPGTGTTNKAPSPTTAPASSAPAPAPAQPVPPQTAPGPATGTTTPGSAQPSAPASTPAAQPTTPSPAPASPAPAPASATPAPATAAPAPVIPPPASAGPTSTAPTSPAQ